MRSRVADEIYMTLRQIPVEIRNSSCRQAHPDRSRLSVERSRFKDMEGIAAVWDVVTSLAPDSDLRTHGPDEFAVDENRAALGLTRRAAGLLVEQAAVIVHRLPCLHAAMAAGQWDEPRARILAELTADLADSSALAICDQLLPQCAPGGAGRLTTGRLAERVKARATALDPNWAQRRYESSLRPQISPSAGRPRSRDRRQAPSGRHRCRRSEPGRGRRHRAASGRCPSGRRSG